MTKRPIPFVLLTSLALACAVDPADSDELSEREAAAEHDAELAAELPPAPEHAPARTMPKARASFDEIAQLVTTRYVDGGVLDEDALWTAAAEGVLARLIQSPAHPVNELLTPEQLGELESGMKGKLSGIGVVIERVGDVLVVRDALPNGPAARAGIVAGDRILGVDGARIDPADLPAVVAKIRGDKGTKVTLFVQRDTEEWNADVTRDDVEIPSVEGRPLDAGIGYVRIGGMGKTTAEHLDATLAQLRRAGVRALVVDLRKSPGGWFEAATAVAERFVPAGAELVRVRDRDGKDEPLLARAAGAWANVPIVVLVDRETSSGAEVVAAALREHAGATLVGQPTVGKTTIEMIHRLDNGWALKLSEKRFVLADGSSGVITPDVPIDMPETTRVAAIDAVDPKTDPPLATAVQLLRGRG